MTTTSSPESSELNPNNECEVCDETRENHGDKMHVFSTDGVLIPIKPGAAPRNMPPRERADEVKRLGRDPEVGALMRLIEVLIEKEVLSAMDVLHVFGGRDAQPGGEASKEYRNPGL